MTLKENTNVAELQRKKDQEGGKHFFPPLYVSLKRAPVLTQNIQRALVVGDDNIRTFSLQMFPAAHFNSKTQ